MTSEPEQLLVALERLRSLRGTMPDEVSAASLHALICIGEAAEALEEGDEWRRHIGWSLSVLLDVDPWDMPEWFTRVAVTIGYGLRARGF